MQPNAPFPQQQPDYGFIMQDPKAPKKKLIPSNGGLLGKVLFIGGGLLIFIILFSVISSLLSPKTDFSGFVVVAQDQQAINHVLSQASEQTGLSEPTKEFILTAQLGMTNDQKQVFVYLNNNKQKVKPKVLALKVSSEADSQLGSASTPSAYDTTFRTIMAKQLDSYGQDLQTERAKFKGKVGQQILDNLTEHNKLLIQKLEAR